MSVSFEQLMNARENRRLANESRILDGWEELSKREDNTKQMIGTLVRRGEEILYVWPQGGKYREGTKSELVSFLIRNEYV